MDKIQLRHVTFRYQDRHQEHTALRDISLSVPEGQFVSIVGQSGCGKTTLIRLISGLAMPSEGEVTIDGAPVTGPAPRRAVVFQDYTLFPWMSARRNIEFGIMQADRSKPRALAMEPEILLLDEPFGALDIRLRAGLQNLLEKLWLEGGKKRLTVLFVTHDIHEAVLLTDRVLYMVPGEIRADIDVPIRRPRMTLCDCENDRLCAIRRELKELF